MLRSVTLLTLLGVAFSLSVALSARADDWAQFRHDAHRSGFSRDAVPSRLIPLWNWEEAQQASPFRVLAQNHEASRPVGMPCVWHGRLLTISNESGRPYLLCVDMRTGLRLWKRPLSAFAGVRKDSGPAVSSSGTVYVPDTTPLVERQIVTRASEGTSTQEQMQTPTGRRNAQSRLHWDPVALPADHTTIRALRIADGAEINSIVLPAAWPRRALNSLITRIWLLDQEPYNLILGPSSQSHWRLGEDPTTFGPLLLVGDQLSVLTGGDMLVQWAGRGPSVFRIAHTGDGPSPDLMPPAVFQGFPMVSVADGVIVLDDVTRRFVGLFSNRAVLVSGIPTGLTTAVPGSGPALVWHRDMLWRMGVPASAGANCFLPVGGDGARGAVIGFEPGSGRQLWSYPPLPALADLPLPASFQAPVPVETSGRPLEDWIIPFLDGRPYGPDEMMLGDWYHYARDGVYGPKYMQVKPGGGKGTRFGLHFYRGESAQNSSLGLVADEKRLFAWMGDSIVALDQADGRVLWKRPQPVTAPLTSIIGAKDRLIVCEDQANFPRVPPHIKAYRMDDGRLDWSVEIPKAGQLITANGMIFLHYDDRILAYAPAERTFRMAIDSSRRDDYRIDLPRRPEPDPAEPAGVAPASPRTDPVTVPPDPDPASKPDPKLADATLVRLRWDEPLPQLLKKATERRALVRGVPMLLSLDWLTADRSARLGSSTLTWADAEIENFASVCAQLAAAVRPEHFEVASEVNVFLIRHPEQRERVRRLVRAARVAVKRASPHTRVLVSFNAELLMDVYGRTHYLPFGEVKLLPELDRHKPQEVAEEVEEVGISTRPQSGYIQPGQVSMNYLTEIRARLGNKPALVTRLELRWDDTDAAEITQAQFTRKLLQALYWLDAPVVAYPDLVWEGALSQRRDVALRVGDQPRPALAYWQDALTWTWAPGLSAHPPDPTAPYRPDPTSTE